jgi:hypothetical protein
MRAEGLDRHLRLEVNDLATLLDLVAEDFGLAIPVHVLGGRVLDGAAGSRQITELREPPQVLTNQRQPTYLPEK